MALRRNQPADGSKSTGAERTVRRFSDKFPVIQSGAPIWAAFSIRKHAHSCLGSIDVQERRCPGVLARSVDVAVSAILGRDECKAVMKILDVSQCFWLDNHLPRFVDIAPFSADLDCRKTL